MRRIIFRGKRADTGEWVFGSLVKLDIGYIILINEKTELDNTLSPKNCIVFSEEEIAVVSPDTVGQFIGLLDKNGKEVYDGDIIKDELGLIGQICWDEGYLQWFTLYKSGEPDFCASWSPCEVVGNNFDNPELMEGGEE